MRDCKDQDHERAHRNDEALVEVLAHALLGGPRFATVAVSFTEAIGGTSAVTWETALS